MRETSLIMKLGPEFEVYSIERVVKAYKQVGICLVC